jgi:hypothetical protein
MSVSVWAWVWVDVATGSDGDRSVERPLELVASRRERTAAGAAAAPALLVQQGGDDRLDLGQRLGPVDGEAAPDGVLQEPRRDLHEEVLVGAVGTERLDELPQGGFEQAGDRASAGAVEDAGEVGGLARGNGLTDQSLRRSGGGVPARHGRVDDGQGVGLARLAHQDLRPRGRGRRRCRSQDRGGRLDDGGRPDHRCGGRHEGRRRDRGGHGVDRHDPGPPREQRGACDEDRRGGNDRRRRDILGLNLLGLDWDGRDGGDGLAMLTGHGRLRPGQEGCQSQCLARRDSPARSAMVHVRALRENSPGGRRRTQPAVAASGRSSPRRSITRGIARGWPVPPGTIG